MNIDYIEINSDSSLHYSEKALSIATKNNKALEEATTLDRKGYGLMGLGKYPESLGCFQQALKLAEDPENENKTWTVNFTELKILHRIKIAFKFFQNTIHHCDFGHLMGATNNIDQQIFHIQGKLKGLAEEAR